MSAPTRQRDPKSARGLPELLQEAAMLQRQGRFEQAARRCEAVLVHDPRHFQALHMLGVVRAQQSRLAEAEGLLRRALEREPGSAAALNNLGMTLNLLRRHAAAIAPLESAIAIDPGYAIAHNNLGTALEALGRSPEACSCFERALALRPDYAEAASNLAMSRMQNGRLEEARRLFETALGLEPGNPAYYLRAFQCYRVTPDDPRLAALERLAQDRGAELDAEKRVQLHFALAKAYADIGQPARAFEQQLAGGALKRRQIVYDEARQLARIERIGAIFTRELMQAKSGLGCPSETPVFILGMMRSGSTLVEQILASHPRVVTAGEVSCLNEAYAALHRSAALPAAFPEVVPALSGEHLGRLGADYLERLRARAGGAAAAHIIDKMPGNFTAAGLIHLALPHARIIHTVRDPVDTCLSCFGVLFSEDQPFTYDLGELGRYYRAYRTLMQHWREVLPQGAMLEVRYEDLVEDFEGQTRRILGYCGLEWHEACRSFHQTQRPVRTASVMQVRRPIYRSSVGRWRPAAGSLAPLLEGLGLGGEAT